MVPTRKNWLVQPPAELDMYVLWLAFSLVVSIEHEKKSQIVTKSIQVTFINTKLANVKMLVKRVQIHDRLLVSNVRTSIFVGWDRYVANDGES